MSFSWPWALLALLILPLVLGAWWLARRTRKRATVRVTSIALVSSLNSRVTVDCVSTCLLSRSGR